MSEHHQTILASRPAAMALALTLFIGLSAPFVMLPRAQADTVLGTASGSPFGTTELSPTPPEDTLGVPPDIVLMLDDSGSMKSDYMPDAPALRLSDQYAMIDAGQNTLYYNPLVSYSPPPKADNSPSHPSFYPDQTDITSVPHNGLLPSLAGETVDLTNYDGNYECNGSGDCGGKNGGITFSVLVGSSSQSMTYPGATRLECEAYYSRTPTAFGGYHWKGGQDRTCTFDYYTGTIYHYFRYSTGPAGGPYTVYYVAPAGQSCDVLPPIPTSPTITQQCVNADDTTGVAAPVGAKAGNNIANWFAYYHTRILMTKSGLMNALTGLNPRYRIGFGSINNVNSGNMPSLNGMYGPNDTEIAKVQAFGDGSSGSQKDAFWTWLTTLVPGPATPLRTALQAVGVYYQDLQPWQSDPDGPALACRAAYTILSTDGIWSDETKQTPPALGPEIGDVAIGNVDGTDASKGAPYTDKDGNTYSYTAALPFSDSSSNTLADVAMYYWKTDLQPDVANFVPTNADDPAFWQHMVTFTVGLGVKPTGYNMPQIFAWSRGGAPAPGFTGWPTITPDPSNSHIIDLAHAAVNGHGGFYSAGNPQELASEISHAFSQISARTVEPTPAAVNASVATIGALSFSTGYDTSDWSGSFEAVELGTDGAVGATDKWNARTTLDADYHSKTGYPARHVYTDAYDASAHDTDGFQVATGGTGSFDASEIDGLETPALAGDKDTLVNRVAYLLGDNTYEGSLYRPRKHLLGAIIRSQPVYIAYPSGNYFNTWPSLSPEIGPNAQTYDKFVSLHASRVGTVYVGANDGMLHAFAAPTPDCTPAPCTYGNGGTERWAFIPRAVYANLGNLTDLSGFHYLPTVDETPVTRDVFFSSDKKWHTILTGGVGLGGRGVYALDVTDPTSFSASDVLWELDSDMYIDTTACHASYGDCQAKDLGFTLGRPNIGRLADGKWVVLVPNGYFPDCDRAVPTNSLASCKAIENQAPHYSALFVIEAETGKVLAELKTPTGQPSFGLSTPVLGDYQNDQIADVAFAGDLQGNLWRFDFSSSTPAGWTVTLAYKGTADSNGYQGVQPITTMPRLFPDPVTNRFMVVFGTGKYLGTVDNGDDTVQSIYGIRDRVDATGVPITVTHGDLTEQTLAEQQAAAKLADGTDNPYAGGTLRTLTDNLVAASKGGWYVDLSTTTSDGKRTDAGERVVVNPGAIFASNTVAFQTLITGAASSDPCNPETQGALMLINALTGGPGSGVSSLGGGSIVGARVNNAHTSGSLPIVSAVSGGQGYIPGMTVSGTTSKIPVSPDLPLWRRRSWQEIQQYQ